MELPNPFELMLFVDTGCAVLALLVQGVIYPTLRDITPERFHSYHAWYTTRITWFVGPLMIAQVLLHAMDLLETMEWAAYISSGLVLSTWVITGIWAVPAHAKLASEGQEDTVISRLLSANLWRALAWSALALLTLFR